MYKKIIFAFVACCLSSQVTVFAASNNAKNLTMPAPVVKQAENIETKNLADLEIVKAWARPSMSPNNNSAVYFTVKNNSNYPYELVGASAIDVANNVELHQTFVDTQGISRMVAIDKIVIPANSAVMLKPGGMHVMLFDLKRTLKVSEPRDKFNLDLKFEGVGVKTIEVQVGASDK